MLICQGELTALQVGDWIIYDHELKQINLHRPNSGPMKLLNDYGIHAPRLEAGFTDLVNFTAGLMGLGAHLVEKNDKRTVVALVS